MGFKEAVTHVFQNYANFSGRARRSEYWYFTLFTLIVNTVLTWLSQRTGKDLNFFALVSSVFSLATFIPGLAVVWRRLHDIGKSGANFFWIFLPLAGSIMLLVWYCREGQHGANQYGPDPKEPVVYYRDDGGNRPPWEY